MSQPKVLLVEDDPSIARFMQMALEELPVDLLTCANVPDAVQVLQQGGIRLVITDLMLPGESGIDLARRMAADPALGGNARIAVFSAGLTPTVREQLLALKVWRMLPKPASVLELEACVHDALSLDAQATQLAAAPLPDTDSSTDTEAAQAEAVATHFAGNAALFKAYRASCIGQFPADVIAGDAACTAQDWPALRRLAHNLGTVLLTLGHPAQSALARRLEDLAAIPSAAESAQHWRAVRDFLTRLQ